MAQFALAHDRVLNTSDPGTGKTRGTLEGYARRKAAGAAGRALVIAPLSILQPSWEADAREYTNLTTAIAHGSPAKRQAAFESGADVVMLNHDGVKWFMKKRGKSYVLDPAKLPLLEGFTDLIIDEFTAFKHRTSQRSKAAKLVSLLFEHITELSGTPSPLTVQDIWHPAYILDNGARLGSRFFQFRSQVCMAQQVGPLPEHVKWVDKPGAVESVADALSDITIRFVFEECIDIPPNVIRHIEVAMPPDVMRAYHDMERGMAIETESGRVSAVHAAARATKMMQILAGAVYGSEGEIHKVHDTRCALAMQLAYEREHSLIAFNWKHQRDQLIEQAEERGLTFAVIDGDVKGSTRNQVVEDFQAGKYRVLLCHPQSASHGLTLVKGTRTIWPSPTANPEWFKQFNRRVYRAGQTERTETICISAAGTRETEVYEQLNQRIDRMDSLLSIFANQTEAV